MFGKGEVRKFGRNYGSLFRRIRRIKLGIISSTAGLERRTRGLAGRAKRRFRLEKSERLKALLDQEKSSATTSMAQSTSSTSPIPKMRVRRKRKAFQKLRIRKAFKNKRQKLVA